MSIRNTLFIIFFFVIFIKVEKTRVLTLINNSKEAVLVEVIVSRNLIKKVDFRNFED